MLLSLPTNKRVLQIITKNYNHNLVSATVDYVTSKPWIKKYRMESAKQDNLRLMAIFYTFEVKKL